MTDSKKQQLVDRAMHRFRSRFDRGPRSLHPALECEKDKDGNPLSRTKQSFKDESDINNIMRRYAKTGQLPDLIRRDPQYGDFSEATEYQEALNLVIRAQAQFEALDARVRDRFGNDPARFLEFVQNGENAEEMVKLGLMDSNAVKRVSDARKAAEAAARAEGKGEAAEAAGGAPRQKPKKRDDAE